MLPMLHHGTPPFFWPIVPSRTWPNRCPAGLVPGQEHPHDASHLSPEVPVTRFGCCIAIILVGRSLETRKILSEVRRWNAGLAGRAGQPSRGKEGGLSGRFVVPGRPMPFASALRQACAGLSPQDPFPEAGASRRIEIAGAEHALKIGECQDAVLGRDGAPQRIRLPDGPKECPLEGHRFFRASATRIRLSGRDGGPSCAACPVRLRRSRQASESRGRP